MKNRKLSRHEIVQNFDRHPLGNGRRGIHKEIEFYPDFKKPLYISLGHYPDQADIVSVSRVLNPFAEIPVDEPDYHLPIGFLIQNAFSKYETSGVMVAMAGIRRHHELVKAVHAITTSSLVRGAVIIGRETTPELELTETTSRAHVYFRVDGLGAGVHLTDLGSTNGSEVYVAKSDRGVKAHNTAHVELLPPILPS